MGNEVKLNNTINVIGSEFNVKSKCPVCELGDGALCSSHELMTKDFIWIKHYINSQEKFNKNIIYILDFAISDRKSNVINDIEIIDGRMLIEEALNKKNISVDRERMLKEILALQKAKYTIIKLMNLEDSGNGNN